MWPWQRSVIVVAASEISAFPLRVLDSRTVFN